MLGGVGAGEGNLPGYPIRFRAYLGPSPHGVVMNRRCETRQSCYASKYGTAELLSMGWQDWLT